MPITTPVVLLIFRRPDLTQQVFNAIAQAKPSKLFIVADGPRTPEEAKLCEETRAVIQQVNWECEVFTNFADKNMGLKRRVASGLDWVFSQVEEAIILEDDCLPAPSFFHFCQTLLEHYRHDERVVLISGNNFQFGHQSIEDSYYFSRYPHIWGWATWRAAWKHFDISMATWPEVRDANLLENILENPYELKYWTDIFEKTYNGLVDSWSYIWTYCCWLQNGLSILPSTNLVSNIGFRDDAVHTKDPDSPFSKIPTLDIWEIQHPKFIVRNHTADIFTFEQMFAGRQKENYVKSKDYIKQLQEQLIQVEGEVKSYKKLLKEVREKHKQTKTEFKAYKQETTEKIAAMESSKFWKLRNIWVKVKTKLALRGENRSRKIASSLIIKNVELPLSPLTGNQDTKVLEVLKTRRLVNAWRDAFKIDISVEMELYKAIYLCQCNQTGLQFFSPINITGSSEMYEKLEQFDWYYMPRKWEHDIAILDLPGCQQVLEVGCGRGAFVERLCSDYHLNAQGIEFNINAVNQAQERGIPIQRIDLHELAKTKASNFDAICSFQVLEHVSDPKEFIDSMICLVKPGGKIIIAVPNRDTFTKYAAASLLDQPPHHVTRWNKAVFQNLTKQFPLRLLHVKYEPLAEYHVDWYFSIQLGRIPKTLPLYDPIKKFLELKVKPLLKSYPFVRSLIRGHTLYVCFQRIN